MKVERLKQTFEKEGMKLLRTTFLEEGYELKVRLIPKDETVSPHSVERERELVDNLKKLDEIAFDGMIAVETSLENDIYSLILVPINLEEMTDFIWKYVEKYGRRDSVLSDILSDAFSSLEKAIENIPDYLETAKNQAMENYEKFSGMIF